MGQWLGFPERSERPVRSNQTFQCSCPSGAELMHKDDRLPPSQFPSCCRPSDHLLPHATLQGHQTFPRATQSSQLLSSSCTNRPWVITFMISYGLKPNSLRGKGRWSSWSIRKTQHLMAFRESAGASVETSGSQASLPGRDASLWFLFVVVLVEEGQILEKKHSSGH